MGQWEQTRLLLSREVNGVRVKLNKSTTTPINTRPQLTRPQLTFMKTHKYFFTFQPFSFFEHFLCGKKFLFYLCHFTQLPYHFRLADYFEQLLKDCGSTSLFFYWLLTLFIRDYILCIVISKQEVQL